MSLPKRSFNVSHDQPDLPDNPYLLLTPGPLSTTKSVKAAMFRDWCTWDDDYNQIVQSIRTDLVQLATRELDCTAVLMQGSGTFTVESVIGSTVPEDGKLLVLANGVYGTRIAQIAECLNIPTILTDSGELDPVDLDKLRDTLATNPDITHVAVVHCETTTGRLNPVEEIGAIVKSAGKIFIVDAMSSFGGVPFSMESSLADFCVSSANKCIQGVPGFGFVVARRDAMQRLNDQPARSLSMDLYDQWNCMEKGNGKWRYTSPTHVVRAFRQALTELHEEGGIPARYLRYQTNQTGLVKGMRSLGFECLLPDEVHSPIITSFLFPESEEFEFVRFYQALKKHGFVIYPGKVSGRDTFRIGNIGDVHPGDIDELLGAIAKSMYWQ